MEEGTARGEFSLFVALTWRKTIVTVRYGTTKALKRPQHISGQKKTETRAATSTAKWGRSLGKRRGWEGEPQVLSVQTRPKSQEDHRTICVSRGVGREVGGWACQTAPLGLRTELKSELLPTLDKKKISTLCPPS